MRAVVILAVLAACGDNHTEPGVAITVDDSAAAWSPAITEMVALTPGPIAIGGGGELGISVVADPAMPAESFLLEGVDDTHWTVHANDILGAQYGTAAALENLGVRFDHPEDPQVPAVLAFAPTTPLGAVQSPAVRVRGLHLHTLHPIEAEFAFWHPGPGNTNDAHHIIDWIIKNRGNYVQWAALNDIASDPTTYTAWQTHTQELLAYAHARGVRVGVNIQLFGQSNLQLAYDLSEDTTGTVPIATEVAQRLPPILDQLPWDVVDLSFGEFLSNAPDTFIAAVNEVQKQLAALAPTVEMHAIVHDGFKQRVEYMGQDLIYYFLVQFASPAIVPDIHTVMYYDLFEDAGLAYQHPDFSEHRAYLESRMCAGQKAAYHPEDAYWVAFDDSVPQWFPLYMASRWLDLHDLAAAGCGPLDEHLPFSSGFEWGYWQNDVASLRASFTLPATSDELVDFVAPDGTADLTKQVIALQHQALIVDRLAAYLASRDAAIDAGRAAMIISQPDRVTFPDLTADPATNVPLVRDTVLPKLQTYADGLAALGDASDLPRGDRWRDEVSDGVQIDQVRAQFVIDLYQAVVSHLGSDDATATARLAAATDLLAQAKVIVARRHAALHDHAVASSGSEPAKQNRLVKLKPADNATFYQYGYLNNADTLCFWHRELTQASAAAGAPLADPAPDCLINN